MYFPDPQSQDASWLFIAVLYKITNKKQPKHPLTV
jgi:hypothetical protein